MGTIAHTSLYYFKTKFKNICKQLGKEWPFGKQFLLPLSWAFALSRPCPFTLLCIFPFVLSVSGSTLSSPPPHPQRGFRGCHMNPHLGKGRLRKPLHVTQLRLTTLRSRSCAVLGLTMHTPPLGSPERLPITNSILWACQGLGPSNPAYPLPLTLGDLAHRLQLRLRPSVPIHLAHSPLPVGLHPFVAPSA